MTFEKGQSGNPNGREKGTTNKYTKLKYAFLEAFEQVGYTDESGEFKGGVAGLVTWVNKNDRNKALFYAWLTKLFPVAITGGEDKDGNPLPVSLSVQDIKNSIGAYKE